MSKACVIRSAVEQDARALAEVHIKTWQSTYRGIMSDNYLDHLEMNELQRRIARWREILNQKEPAAATFVATIAGKVVGFVSVGPPRDTPPPAASELYAIYLLPAEQKKGIGRQLLAQAIAFWRGRGIASFSLWVAKGNPTEGFYLHFGGRKDKEQVDTINGQVIPESRYVWDTLPSLRKED